MNHALFRLAFPIIAGVVVIAIADSTSDAQTNVAGGNPVIVVERTGLAQRLGYDLAPSGASVVTLGAPMGAISPTSNRTAALSVSASKESPANERYFITDLGTLGGSQSFAYAINDLGQIVGGSSINGDLSSHSFLYSNGKMTDLSPLNSQNLQTVGPTSINNAGQIASGVISGGIYLPAILDSRTGDLKVLGSLGGVTSYGFNGVTTSINNLGSAVGYSYTDGVNRHAFLSRFGLMFDIGRFDGYSAALSINDAGVIVGFGADSDGVAHAFLTSNGVITKIHPTTESYARDINNNGEVVGEFLTADQTAFHAFLYSHGSFTDLGLAGSFETNAYAINDLSQIVGVVYSGSGQHAFLYDRGAVVNLNSVVPQGRGWQLNWAFDVNNKGQIVGSGLLNNRFRAYVLTPAVSSDQCKDGGWEDFGFKNQGQCIQFVNNGK